jgi:hypothetical protein
MVFLSENNHIVIIRIMTLWNLICNGLQQHNAVNFYCAMNSACSIPLTRLHGALTQDTTI